MHFVFTKSVFCFCCTELAENKSAGKPENAVFETLRAGRRRLPAKYALRKESRGIGGVARALKNLPHRWFGPMRQAAI